MGRRNDHSREEIQALALQAATQIIETQGLQGLSARKVAAAIGYTVGSLYLVFENLDDLILQINANTLDQLFQDVVHADSVSHATPEAAILAMCHAYLQFSLTHQHRWRTIFEHNLLPTKQKIKIKIPAWYQKKLLHMFIPLENRLALLLPDLMTEQCSQVAFTLWSSVHGICILAVGGKFSVISAGTPIQHFVNLLVENYLAGLKVNSRTSCLNLTYSKY